MDYKFQSLQEEQFPVLVQLALAHYICNSRCKKCPVGLLNRGLIEPVGEYDPAKKHFFPFEIFPKIADEIGKHPWSILRFHGRGEPLLHPHYTEMIAYAKKAKVGTVTSFTNATLLNSEMAEAILNAGLDLLELSIDAYTEQLYREFRGTNYFRRVVRNAENFIRKRNRRGSQCRTRIIVSAVDCPEFQPEKTDFQRFWSERADQVIFRPYHTYGGRLKPIDRNCQAESVPCAQLWTRFSINPWGQVNACFNDWADEELVGDLNEPDATIAKIWRNDKFETIRKASLEGASILKCCANCLATKESWIASYQSLIAKLQTTEPNHNL
jgi:sulfatase maturation enzyme AslB (radical SAM superfamily)